jgi:hypothetical protein
MMGISSSLGRETLAQKAKTVHDLRGKLFVVSLNFDVRLRAFVPTFSLADVVFTF